MSGYRYDAFTSVLFITLSIVYVKSSTPHIKSNEVLSFSQTINNESNIMKAKSLLPTNRMDIFQSNRQLSIIFRNKFNIIFTIQQINRNC